MGRTLRQWWSERPLRRLSIEELTEIAGNDWTQVWRKLELQPLVSNSVALGEFAIEGKPAVPIIGFVGFSTRADVCDALRTQLNLDDTEASLFLDCQRDREFVVARVEASLASFDDL